MKSEKVRNVVILVARCAQTSQPFGMRMERQGGGNHWSATWSFAIREGLAKKEGYDKTRIEGVIDTLPTYPGCPHCRNHGYFKCSCGEIGCWNGESRRVACPSCKKNIELRGQITQLDAGSDA